MMRLLVGLLLALNILLFLYGYLGMGSSGEPPQRQRSPDFGSIRLLDVRVVDSEAEKEEPPTELSGIPEIAADEVSVPEDEEAGVSLPSTAEQVETAEVEAETADTAMVPDQISQVETAEPLAEVAGETEETAPDEEAASEVEEEPEQSLPVVVAEAEPSRYCGQVGPLTSRAQARRLERMLEVSEGVAIEKKPTMVDRAYWVLIPPLPDLESARLMVKQLKEQGVDDIWLVPKGELRNAISLGLYSRREAAYSHAENIRGKGFEVEVRPKQEEVGRYWLVFSGLTEESLARLEGEALPRGAGMEKKVCAQASSVP